MCEIVVKFSLPSWLVWITSGLGLQTNVFFSNIWLFVKICIPDPMWQNEYGPQIAGIGSLFVFCKRFVCTSGFEGFRTEEASFKELEELHDYVTQSMKQKSVIIDSDDLQRDPGSYWLIGLCRSELKQSLKSIMSIWWLIQHFVNS